MNSRVKQTTTVLLLALVVSRCIGSEQNLTALFHEALSSDGGLQSSVGMTGEMSDLELVYLRRRPYSPLPDLVMPAREKRRGRGLISLSYNFKAFGKNYELQLVSMSNLVSAKAEVVFVAGNEKVVSRTPIPPTSCHYTHVDHRITAALNGCNPGTLTGYVVSENTTLEVRPLAGPEAEKLHHAMSKRGGSSFFIPEGGVPHVVRRIIKTTQPQRPNPSDMNLEIPHPPCSEPIGNATPDDMEFGQGEIFTIPPKDLQTSPPPVIEVAFFPEDDVPPRPSPPVVGSPVEEDPEGLFLPPLTLLKRNLEEIPDQQLNGKDRQPKPMQGIDRNPKPMIFTAEPPLDEQLEKRGREPKPMKGVDREPKPMIFTTEEPSVSQQGNDRQPKPMKGVDRVPKPMILPTEKPIVRQQRNDRQPKPMKGVDREPKPMILPTEKPIALQQRNDRQPKPMQGIDREPKPMIFTTKKPLDPGTGINRQPKPMKGVDREPKPLLEGNQPTKRSGGGKTVELGVFVDQAAYDLFFPYLKSQKALTDVILGYVNGIQALFHHPTLGQKIRLVINYVEVMSKQPESLPHFGGDREKLYESFRRYNERKNNDASNEVDGNPWDMGILISGLNFYSVKKVDGKTSYSTMGLAAVRGVCHPGYSAVIVELGATDTWGKPYPSAGFASVYVMAHEMGHNLGMLHDGYGNSCPKNGYVMSASRSTSGETNWSSCSREIIETMKAPCLSDNPTGPFEHDHSVYEQLPGQTWDAYDQCRVFLRDNDATLYNETIGESVCQTVMCRSPHRIGYFKAGPALDGTYCGAESWCIAGTCTPWPADRTPRVILGGWSSWEHTKCSSGCIVDSMGVQVSHRKCTNPKPRNTAQRCLGLEATLNVCEDEAVCNGKRLSVTTYADEKCKEFSQVVDDLKPIGAQAPHNQERKWQACAIFCQRGSGTWYSPRTDLSHLPHFDTYFPDGTVCHTEGKIKYYCQRHQCLPKGERQAKELQEPDPEWDVHVYQNAPPRPSNNTVPEQVAKIFELTENMDPLQVEPLDLMHEDDEDLWEDNDYYHPL